MAFTRRVPVYGSKPPCAYSSRLEERRQLIRNKRLERSRKSEKPDDFIVYHSSDEEEDENDALNHQVLYSSNNFVDYVRAREYRWKEYHTLNMNYGTRHALSHDMLKEHPITLDSNVNKIFCSAWLSHRQVVCGTKCNKLIVYDVLTKAVDQIPCLVGHRENVGPEDHNGIHAVSINPSKSLIATGGKNANEVGIYKLPTLDPAYIGEEAHNDSIFDIVWLDDQFLATCSRDSKVALWRVPEIEPASTEIPSYSSINPLVIKTCKHAQKARAFAFNKPLSELATLSLNGYIHIWNIERFKQKLSSKLNSSQEPVSLCVNETGSLYAVGCRTYALLIDSRCLQLVKKVTARHTGVRSTSFKSELLTVGSGAGVIQFYDLRAQKPLESGVNSRTVLLRTSRGYVNPEDEFIENGMYCARYTPAIYTHCYDSSGMRLFCAGGPLSTTLSGNYASVWQ
ncbi:hypothetical protein V9T40_012205 [Parthenolecanium corni]|uniref:DDB1- and CUL4-associated factor 12 beta-propeller domain-containing protein n=1 Tax=Parthenolecanium corni TaxID=536013 RepID=A0AAN9T886_9HEMI